MNKKLSNIMAVRKVGSMIKAGIKDSWLSKTDVAGQVGINYTMFHGVIAGKVKLPTKYAHDVARVLSLDETEFRAAVVKQYKPRH